MKGRIRFMTAITHAYAHAYQAASLTRQMHFPATSIHGRVPVTRVTVHIVDTVAISTCIRLTVINVLGYFSPVIAFLTPLLGMIELIQIFEFGMSEPIQAPSRRTL